MLDKSKDKLLKTLLKATKQNRIKYKIKLDGKKCEIYFSHEDIKDVTSDLIVLLRTSIDEIIPRDSVIFKPTIWVYSNKKKISETIRYNKEMELLLKLLEPKIKGEVSKLNKLEEKRVGEFLSDLSDNIGKDLYRESRLDRILGKKK